MSKKKHHAEEHENEERWLLTYADLITLLMVFFVVMYAMSNADKARFQQLATSLRQVLGPPSAMPPNISGTPIPMPAAVPPSAVRPTKRGEEDHGTKRGSGEERYRRLSQLKEEVTEVVQQHKLEDMLDMKLDPKGPKLIIGLSDTALFDVGTADLGQRAQKLMLPLGEALRAQPYDIHVEGHTDDVPISSQRYSSNFALSTERAVNVVMYFINNSGIPPERLSASGYGEFRPIADNDTEEGRAKNRRVEFVIYSEEMVGGLGLEPISDGDSTEPNAEEAEAPSDTQ